MKNFQKNIKLYVGLAALALVASCKPEITNDFEATNNGGNVDFSKYIAVGNSLTAGFADGGLYLEGQQVAFPNLVAEKMKNHGGGEFNTPFFSEAQSNGSGYIRLKDLVNGNPVTESVTDKVAYTGANTLAKYDGGEIHNLGVPGMRIDHSGVGVVSAANMYFKRLVPDTEVGSKSYQQFVTGRNHTFFTFWLGNNDVLGYASNGGYEDPLDPTTAYTSEAVFKTVYTNFINLLTDKNQKGVLATIPDVTSVPFFTTVTTARIEAGVKALTQGAYEKIYITTANGVRTATSEDLFTLRFPTDTLGKAVVYGNPMTAGYGLIPQNPLHDKFVLDKDEIADIKARVNNLNTFIKEIANSKNLAVADANAMLTRLKTGINYNGVGVSSAFITGNAFSLDGIHLTPMGNAIMANLMIDAINAKYGTKLEKVDATGYRGVKMP